jgi:putative NADH-flavin reductase
MVLGANGAVGQSVINALEGNDVIIKGVSRNGQIEGVISANADLLDAQQSMQVVEGSDIVYLCIGLSKE